MVYHPFGLQPLSSTVIMWLAVRNSHSVGKSILIRYLYFARDQDSDLDWLLRLFLEGDIILLIRFFLLLFALTCPTFCYRCPSARI